jgi:hypothetical protein
VARTLANVDASASVIFLCGPTPSANARDARTTAQETETSKRLIGTRLSPAGTARSGVIEASMLASPEVARLSSEPR